MRFICHPLISQPSLILCFFKNKCSFNISPLLQQKRERNCFFSHKNSSFCYQLMEDHKEKNAGWLSVPQFGDWDQKGVIPDYSMDFSKIREMRKQNKRDPSRASIGNEEDLISSASRSSNSLNTDNQSHSPIARRSIFSYFNCCLKA